MDREEFIRLLGREKGTAILRTDDQETAARAMEALVPVSLLGLGEKRQRYGFFTNQEGGIMDDLMLANRADHMFVVVNAACKVADIAHMRAGLEYCEVEEITDRALIALQGPAAETALARLNADVAGAAEKLMARIADAQLANRVVYAEALGLGLGAAEGRKTPARAEVDALTSEVAAVLANG